MKWVRLILLTAPAALAATPVTFSHDIAPLVYQHCAPCHHAGGSGPFPLITYDDVKKHGSLIAAVTRSRYMPPWLPEPGHGEFADAQRLTSPQIAAIQEWVKQGMPQGDRAQAPEPPRFNTGWQLGTPDLVIRASKPYAVPAEGRDVFWNFVFSPAVSQTKFIRAIEIKPGNPQLAHHANVLIDRGRAARSQEKHPGEGFAGMDLSFGADAFDPDSHFLFWKPGSLPFEEPKGLAWRLDPGNDLVLNMHLQPSGKSAEEQPSLALYFTSEPQTKFPMLIQLERDGALDIPAGDADFRVRDDFRLPMDVDVLAVYPHAHFLGKVLEGYATLPDGTKQWLVRVPDWNLNWQGVFRCAKPVFLPKGTLLSMRYSYDNSEANPRNPNHPTRRVVGGNQASDEMSHLWLQVLPRGEGDQRPVLQEALMLHRLEKYPADFSAHYNLGALLLSRQDKPGAIAHLRAAVGAKPDEPVALNTLGAALESEGQLQEAITRFRQSLLQQPDYTNARYNLANALAEHGELEQACAEYEGVLSADPADVQAKDHLAQVLAELASSLAQQRNFREAAKRFQELVDLRPQDAGLRNTLGSLYTQAGDLPHAVEQFRTAVDLDPSNEQARQNLALAIVKNKR